MYQIDKESYEHQPNFVSSIKNLRITSIDQFDPNIPAIVLPKGFQNLELFQWVLTYRKYVLIENPYWGNYEQKERNWYRITYNSLQNYKYKSPSHSRKHLLSWPVRDWKTTNKNIIVALPNSYQIQLLGTTRDEWTNKIKQELKDEQNVIWRTKPNIKPKNRYVDFVEQLKNSKKVITFVSMAAIEAALYNIPVECDKQCSAHLLNTITKEQWLDHLAWSQYHIDEFLDGSAWKLFEEYQLN